VNVAGRPGVGDLGGPPLWVEVKTTESAVALGIMAYGCMMIDGLRVPYLEGWQVGPQSGPGSRLGSHAQQDWSRIAPPLVQKWINHI